MTKNHIDRSISIPKLRLLKIKFYKKNRMPHAHQANPATVV